MSVKHLVEALRDLGFQQVETLEDAQHLYGYHGDVRPQTAEVIIRRQFVGTASNDIGFKRGADGTFDAIISEFDSRRFGEAWLAQLSQRYAYRVVKEQLETQDFSVLEETVEQDQTVHLFVRRMV